MKSTVKTVQILVFVFLLTAQTFPRVKIKLLETVTLSQETQIVGSPMAFCVTGDGMFIIPDYKIGDVKVYSSKGERLNTFGRKGRGPNELVNPAFCCYSKDAKKLALFDYGLRKIFIYQRTGKKDFKRVKEIYCLNLGTDLQLEGNKLYISGQKLTQYRVPHELYAVEFDNNRIISLLPSFYKYGFSSGKNFGMKDLKKPEINAIGRKGWFDIQGNHIYYIWEGDSRIIKINIESGNKKPTSFGHKSPNYVKPYPSKQLIEARRKRDNKAMKSAWNKMSLITNLFTNTKYVLVIFKGPINKKSEITYWMQLYTLSGEFKHEIPIPETPDYRMYFDKDKNILYSLTTKSDAGSDYTILKYRIKEEETK